MKEKMDELRGVIDWPEEIREFIRRRVEECLRLRALEEVSRELERLPKTPRGLAARLVRGDRDSH